MSGSIACAPRWQKDCWMTNSHLNLPTTSVSSNIDSWWASLCSLKYALSYVMKTICGYKSVWAIVDFCSYPQFFFSILFKWYRIAVGWWVYKNFKRPPHQFFSCQLAVILTQLINTDTLKQLHRVLPWKCSKKVSSKSLDKNYYNHPDQTS